MHAEPVPSARSQTGSQRSTPGGSPPGEADSAPGPVGDHSGPPGGAPAPARRLTAELLIVLGLSLGQSGVYAIVNLAEKLTRGPLSGQTTTLNPVLNDRQYFDLTYQLLNIAFALVPVVLVLFLLSGHGVSAFRRLGFTFEQPLRTVGFGFGLAAIIGVGTLGVYAGGRALGITTAIVPAALDAYWWTIPVLVLSAVRHAILEEIIVVGYLVIRLRELGWSTPAIILTSALLRGSYHLYQGFGPFIGNVLMGLLFAWFYTRTRRVMPLVIAHALIDITGFVGFALIGPAIGIGG
ncbi:CPBP family intramembrane metalloprotease [Arthrobacter agilis]|uniref:CPBP family intramembrane glutamic endopeptidase n=1 Tax=Arthrobacter agilis TaxID=37921 RepID=UPI000B358394|nr:CPBP family intramembrane glutamic endopeptidase [Arthrobacter agilis]OUM40428.1 CPBP family intramembrane metalloprotease domain-containing protein [Arthrobacter agilis]PPB45043.1 CPBP family intramembrane metalloprotease [Arthrobacter agilis]TPV27745.1 CPBP family intramembrane metalloprotease [Arthrobacter agilis]VDR31609.1 CAAX amino terminal protease self- immunity [Arthrobacter agilis]